jgi:acetolactate synthase-1/2/3 large subunit
MGFGLPTAMGAAMANPDKRVVCFSGDGSIMMNIQELATLAEVDCNLTVIVLVNGVLGMVHQHQEKFFNKNYSASVFERTPDFVAIARAFGIRATDTTEEGWEAEAFGKPGACLVVCRISASENVYPQVPAGRANVDAITGD